MYSLHGLQVLICTYLKKNILHQVCRKMTLAFMPSYCHPSVFPNVKYLYGLKNSYELFKRCCEFEEHEQGLALCLICRAVLVNI